MFFTSFLFQVYIVKLFKKKSNGVSRSVLERKLARIALRIGYAGFLVAMVALFVLVIRRVALV